RTSRQVRLRSSGRLALLSLTLLVGTPLLLTAQAGVRGQVVDAETNAPLSGAQVAVRGSNVGTVTNASGEFSLPTTPGTATLVFSMIGYAGQEVAIEGRPVVNVGLTPSAVSLEGLVVVGY